MVVLYKDFVCVCVCNFTKTWIFVFGDNPLEVNPKTLETIFKIENEDIIQAFLSKNTFNNSTFWTAQHMYFYIFTKLSQNVCLINIHILIYQFARCKCKLWKAHCFYCVFLGIFIYNWRAFMSKVFYLHQTFIDCLSD